MRSWLTWYTGCLAIAWRLVLAALMATVPSPVWAGNNCQPVPQRASEQVAEVSVVLAVVVTCSPSTTLRLALPFNAPSSTGLACSACSAAALLVAVVFSLSSA